VQVGLKQESKHVEENVGRSSRMDSVNCGGLQLFSVAESSIIIMAARQLCWPPAILFYRCSLDLSFFLLLFSPPHLRGRLADRHQTLPHVRW